jgi:cytochrome c peroxidase
VSYRYSDADLPLPPLFFIDSPILTTVVSEDNTPKTNPVTNDGATLGRVLFYDVRLSANDRVSCGSCHEQTLGFGDTARFSRGFRGALTRRHAMALVNVRFHMPSQFFGDGRAPSLETAVLMPIQDTIEMGSSMPDLLEKLAGTRYYPALFKAAFGTPEVSSERIGRALAQFLRSIVSYDSKFDRAFPAAGGPPRFAATLTAEELVGQQLFEGTAHCFGCHRTYAQVTESRANNGLGSLPPPADTGTGCAMFKAASLRNIAVRPPYMHDGRFATLEQVIDHYDFGIRTTTPCLDRRLANDFGVAPRRLNLTALQRNALIAFLKTLTDSTLLTAAKFSNPFPAR